MRRVVGAPAQPEDEPVEEETNVALPEMQLANTTGPAGRYRDPLQKWISALLAYAGGGQALHVF